MCGIEVGVGHLVEALHVAVNQLGAEGGTEVPKPLLTNTTLTELDLRGE